MMLQRYAPTVLLVCAVLTGCSRSIGRDDLIGRYAVVIKDERQTIQLHENGTYENAFYRKAALVWKQSGKWTYQIEPGMKGQAITFERFQFGFSEYDRFKSPGLWGVEPDRSFLGRVGLCFDPDLNNRCFVRQES